MRKHLKAWVLAVLLLAGGNAHAVFHLWTMTELYSNADGSVQFLELRALSAVPWNQPSMPVTQANVGTVSLAFSGASAGTFTYTLEGVTQTKPIVRNLFGTPATICR